MPDSEKLNALSGEAWVVGPKNPGQPAWGRKGNSDEREVWEPARSSAFLPPTHYSTARQCVGSFALRKQEPPQCSRPEKVAD